MKPARRPVDLAQRLVPFQQAITLPAHVSYCVYTHSARGTVFYIGSGRATRPFEQTDRTGRWWDCVRQHDAYEVAIVLWTDDVMVARQEEARLIAQYLPPGNKIPSYRRAPHTRPS